MRSVAEDAGGALTAHARYVNHHHALGQVADDVKALLTLPLLWKVCELGKRESIFNNNNNNEKTFINVKFQLHTD